MTVEIRELVIRAVVDREVGSADEDLPRRGAPDEVERIVEECVQQVMRILRRKEER